MIGNGLHKWKGIPIYSEGGQMSMMSTSKSKGEDPKSLTGKGPVACTQYLVSHVRNEHTERDALKKITVVI